jgi:hypothetical protein
MSEEGDPADTMRERAGLDRWKVWLLIDAPRPLVVAGVLAAVVGSLLVAAVLSPAAAAILRTGDAVETLFQSLLGATVTGVTLVVTLNQVVLSQELAPVGEQREKMEAAGEFRRDVADYIDAQTSPPDPAALLAALVEAAADRAGRLQDGLRSDAPDAAHRRVAALADGVTGDADAVAAALADAEFGTFTVVSAALDFEYAGRLSAARQVAAVDSEHLSEDGVAAVGELAEVLELYGSAREHVKTLYVQWELVNLSRGVLVAALPAVTVAVGMLLLFDPVTVTGTVAGVSWVVVAVVVAVGVALTPFAVLVATMLRLATVAQRTLSVGAFTLRDTDDGDAD